MSKEKISNPLTIVGIFSGIAEVAGTTVIGFLSTELQSIFIWYVMCFPVLLVLLFFITWNFNPTVLYSPSDYQNEDNFLTILTKKYKNKMESDINELSLLLENAKKGIVNETIKAIDSKKSNSQNYLESLVENKMKEIRNKLDETKQNTSEFTDFTIKYTNSYLQSKITDLLSDGSALSLSEIAACTKMSRMSLRRALERLCARRILECEGNNKTQLYRLVK